jgi:large subunit ribosomal protein L32
MPFPTRRESDLAMAVPKRRTSHARQGKRRSHLHVKRKQNTYCNNCQNPVLPHYVCWNCGYLNTQGREAAPVKEEEES